MLTTTTLLDKSKAEFSSEVLKDGEYYVFTQQERSLISIGYLYSTWYGSPCGMRIGFYPVEIGKPLSLRKISDNGIDKGYLKKFAFDRANPLLADHACGHAIHWLRNMRREKLNPQLDVTQGCRVGTLRVSDGILTAINQKHKVAV